MVVHGWLVHVMPYLLKYAFMQRTALECVWRFLLQTLHVRNWSLVLGSIPAEK